MGLIFAIGAITASVSLLAILLLYLFPWLKDDLVYIKRLIKFLSLTGYFCYRGIFQVDIFEKRASEQPRKPFLYFEDDVYSYGESDRCMNRVAHAGLDIGIQQGHVVALFMWNEPEFIWTFYGLSKIGAELVFINYNLRGPSLSHVIKTSGASFIIVSHSKGDELLNALKVVQDDLAQSMIRVYFYGSPEGGPMAGFESFDDQLESASGQPIPRHYRSSINRVSPWCNIYTSGTTGLPKAAIIRQQTGVMFPLTTVVIGTRADDVVYVTLPLYHSAASQIALGGAVYQGGSIVLRNKFSASQFWEDCHKYKVTAIQYIGELCRYLLATKQSPYEKEHSVRMMFGNGLRNDIWIDFQTRFNIPQIVEYYGATEAVIGMFNIHNKVGGVGRLSPIMQVLGKCCLVRYDVENDEVFRNEEGKCVKAELGEPGLLIAKLRFKKKLYKGDSSFTKKKCLFDVFVKGDCYYNTGDLLTLDKDYNAYFADRMGDTFRWKGENVSTIEVSNMVCKLPWVEDANVYGISLPDKDGRVGMAALTLAKGHDLDLPGLYCHIEKCLPAYARPCFLRVQEEMAMTPTFKQQKVTMIKEGFDPSVTSDDLYCIDNAKKTFVQIDKELYQQIMSSKIRF